MLAPRRRRPAELLKALNDALIERRVESRYVTLCVLLWDPVTRHLVMANAGALPPLICRANEIVKVRVEGVPLGLLASREYEEVPFQLHPDDLLVLYSDGITDHINSAGLEYGRGRLAQVVRSHCGRPSAEIVSEIFKDVDRFAKTAFDDQTVLVMKVR